MPFTSPAVSNEENAQAILDNLQRQGLDNARQYVAGAEFIFSLREWSDSSSAEFYDVILRMPRDERWPPYIRRCVADAIRAEVLEDVTVLNVQFAVFDDASRRYVTRAVDTLSDKSLGLNNCFFKRGRTLLHDELRFRSKAEIAVYDELKQRNLLLFPNPAAVLGTAGTEFGAKIDKKEPDFLICCNGKWGVLEINGSAYHSGPNTAKDHDRARRFQHYGLFFFQAFDSEKCVNDPVGIVDEFLKLLAAHK